MGDNNRNIQLKEQSIKVNQNRIQEVQEQLDNLVKHKLNKLSKIAVNFENFEELKNRLDAFEGTFKESNEKGAAEEEFKAVKNEQMMKTMEESQKAAADNLQRALNENTFMAQMMEKMQKEFKETKSVISDVKTNDVPGKVMEMSKGFDEIWRILKSLQEKVNNTLPQRITNLEVAQKQ